MYDRPFDRYTVIRRTVVFPVIHISHTRKYEVLHYRFVCTTTLRGAIYLFAHSGTLSTGHSLGSSLPTAYALMV